METLPALRAEATQDLPAGAIQIVESSGLDWAIAQPPQLTNGPLSRNHVVADGRLPQGARLTTSRADVANFLLDEVERPAHVHRIVGLASMKAARRIAATNETQPM